MHSEYKYIYVCIVWKIIAFQAWDHKIAHTHIMDLTVAGFHFFLIIVSFESYTTLSVVQQFRFEAAFIW